VLALDGLTTVRAPEQFVAGLSERLASLLAECGAGRTGQEAALLTAAQDALERNPGSGYRRHVVKQSATRALQFL
jgi:hypothetical protein